MRKSKYGLELLQPVVARSLSIGGVLRELGLRPTGGNYRMIHCRLRVLGINTGHFRGMGWSRGETVASHPTVSHITQRITRTDEQVFIENSPVICGWRLIKRLVKKGWKYHCSECGLSEWRGQALHLHLDHVNGISNDNRLENLRFLCPNCHSQTITYCRKKIGREAAR